MWIANYTRKLKWIWGIGMINVDIILHFIMIEATLSDKHFCLISSNIKICKICKYQYVKGFAEHLVGSCYIIIFRLCYYGISS